MNGLEDYMILAQNYDNLSRLTEIPQFSDAMEDKLLAEKTIGDIADFLLTKTDVELNERGKLQGLKQFSLCYAECIYAKRLVKTKVKLAIFPDKFNVHGSKILPTKIVKVNEETRNEEILKRIKLAAVRILISTKEKEVEILGISETAWQAINRHTENLRREQDAEETKQVIGAAQGRGSRSVGNCEDGCCNLI